jgi:hypothetical protein
VYVRRDVGEDDVLRLVYFHPSREIWAGQVWNRIVLHFVFSSLSVVGFWIVCTCSRLCFLLSRYDTIRFSGDVPRSKTSNSLTTATTKRCALLRISTLHHAVNDELKPPNTNPSQLWITRSIFSRYMQWKDGNRDGTAVVASEAIGTRSDDQIEPATSSVSCSCWRLVAIAWRGPAAAR